MTAKAEKPGKNKTLGVKPLGPRQIGINSIYHNHFGINEWTKEKMDAVGELILHGRPRA